MKRYIRRTASVIALALVAGGSGTAFAQETTGQDTAAGPDTIQTAQEIDNTPSDKVTITGSRVASGADAPTPVTAVTADVINQVRVPNIADALVQLPALRTSVTSSKGGQGLTVGSALNLRSLAPFRTLVLVDGKRFVTTPPFAAGQGQYVNVDAIPQNLVRQVDTVTGGASAAYGSDAVAGVVNFILDKEFEGLKGGVSYGQSTRDDGRRYTIDLAAGGSFDGGRGHLLVSAEYGRDEGIDNDSLGLVAARPFQEASRTIGRETFNGTQVIVPNARFANIPLNGLILGCVQNGVQRSGTACPVYGTSFNDDGTATQVYNFGTRNSATSVFANGGDGYAPGPQSVLATPTTRTLLFGRADYDVTDRLNVYFEVENARTYSLSEAGAGSPPFATGNALGAPLGVNYAYLPENLRTQMVGAGISTIYLQKYFEFNVQQTFENRTNRVVTGATYNLDDNWTADVYYTYGETRNSMKLNNFTNTVNFQNSLTAVKDPVTGAITCTQGGSSCVPYNIFGRDLLTAAESRYINPTNFFFTTSAQQVAEATIDGTLFALPAGNLDVALGGGYRKEALDESTDALGLSAGRNPYTGAPGANIYLNSPAINGELELFEAFGEAQVPLLSDMPFINSLDLNLAARYSDYSSSGGVTTWKAGLVWAPIDGLRFRAAQSRDVRAANLVELYNPQSTGFGSVRDPVKGQNVSVIPIASGNASLTPEEADTKTLGVVWTPSFFPQVTASIDYFEIEIVDQIATLSAQRTVDLCQLSSSIASYATYCARITRTPSTNDITTIATPYSNLASAQNRGVDVELGYTEDLDLFGTPGQLSLKAYGTYVYENSVTPPGVPAVTQDAAGSVGQLQALLTATYVMGDWTFGVQEHFVSPGRYDTGQARYVGDRSHGQWWTDVTIKRRLGDWEIFGSVQNLFDQDPPVFPFASASSGFGTSPNFDVQGSRYMFGARFSM